MKAATVGELIEGAVRTTRLCQWCKDFAEVDLQKIAAAKGAEFSLVDRLPICTNGECLGMVRFQIHQGMRTDWLMTAAGDARFQAHSDWLFTHRQILLRRERQRAAQTKKGRHPEG